MARPCILCARRHIAMGGGGGEGAAQSVAPPGLKHTLHIVQGNLVT